MKVVYVVQHVHLLNGDEEEIKMIGVYSTHQLAQEAVERAKTWLGFRDTQEGFSIDEYELNQDSWTEGYITVHPGDIT